MSESTRELRYIVELDLCRYSDIARFHEQSLGVGDVQALNDQIQDFVRQAAEKVGLTVKNMPYKKTGDGAIIAFDNAEKATQFAEEFHRIAERNNSSKNVELAQRHFRIGVYSDTIVVEKELTENGTFAGFEMAGTAIGNAVRLEAACRTGEILICCYTWADLPRAMKGLFGPEETIKGKRSETFRIHRRKIIDPAPWEKVKKTPEKAIETPPRISPEHISLSKLPTTGTDLFGREKELALLDEAWDDQNTAILTLVAWGGVGKTALVNRWLNDMARESFRGAERVFGWSFYRQGTREDRQASGDEFIDRALRELGDPDLSLGSPWDKGVRLANLIRRQRTLLVLDGLEPLQYPPGEMGGCLRDRGVQALVKELTHFNRGLCIITTREDVRDIQSALNATVKRIDLEELSHEAGVQLLKSLGVQGTDRELRDAAREFNGHALALTLLGSYLTAVHDGDIRKRDLVPALAHDEEHGGHARCVMESYERWLVGTPELSILYLMGLFDRPADGGAIDALRKEPVIGGLTDTLLDVSHDHWQYTVKRLRDLRLLAERDDCRSNTLDCHLFIREHFGEKLRDHNPAAWKEAHSRLYEYYKNLPKKEFPDTLDEMQPLFAAVAHGCMAGRYQETMDDVYWERINRQTEFFSTFKLGAYGADLAALSGFFETPWSIPVSGLSDHDKGSVLSWAGFRLRALGRLREAIQPMQAGLNANIQENYWESAAIAAGNLSELFLTMGEVNRAVEFARQSVEYAERSEDAFKKYVMRTTLADTLHQSGDLAGAEIPFQEAESMQKEDEPDSPFLYSLRGFRFCDLLLGTGRYREVLERAKSTIEIARINKLLLDIALDTLSLGRACLLQVQEEQVDDFSMVKEYLKKAVDGFREAGDKEFIARGLLACAELYRVKKEYQKAHTDLDEAREIAERGGMRLYMADYHLEAARLCLAEGDRDKAREHRETAKKMINEMGYHRRDREVEELERLMGEEGRSDIPV